MSGYNPLNQSETFMETGGPEKGVKRVKEVATERKNTVDEYFCFLG